MFDFNTTLNPHSYLALFELKSVVIFICFCYLIISFKLCKFTQTLLLSKSELLFSVSLLKLTQRSILINPFGYFIYLRLVITL